MFSKRHYDFLAAFMAKQERHARRQWAHDLCRALEREAAQSGVNFKSELFIRACKLEG